MEAIKTGTIYGYKQCPQWLKNKYYEAVKGICQECKKQFPSLEPHRLTRAEKGGLYTACRLNHPENNVKVVCKSCHKSYHANEFPHVSRGY